METAEIEFRSKNPKQIQAAGYWLDKTTEELLYGGAKYGGKSYLGVSLIFGDALIYPGTQYFIARHTLADLRKFTAGSIGERFQHIGLDINQYAPFNGQDNVYNLYNGSKVFLLECKELPSDSMFERFGSMQMTRGWIEEGGEIAEAAKANLALSIGRWKNDEYKLKKKLLITANPKKGWMKREFIIPFKEGELEEKKKYIQAFATDNIHGSKDYVEMLRNEKDKVRRQRLWQGSWDYDEDENSLVSYDALTDMFTNTIDEDEDKFLIVDVARLGKDKTAFSYWKGLHWEKTKKFEKQTTEKTEEAIRDEAAKEKIPYSNILIDEGGVGGGVVDHLPGTKGFVSNASPFPTRTEIIAKDMKHKIQDFPEEFIKKRNFANLKAQCGFKLAELINNHKIKVSDFENRDEIIEDVTALLKQKDHDKDRKLELVPKDEVKQEIARSPDLGDTGLMRMWFEVRKDAINKDPAEEKAIVERLQSQFSRNKSRQHLNSTR